MTPRLAVAVNFAQFVALASHSKFSLQSQKKTLVRQHCLIQLNLSRQASTDELPEELVAGCPRVHERVGDDRSRVANRISDCVLGCQKKSCELKLIMNSVNDSHEKQSFDR